MTSARSSTPSIDPSLLLAQRGWLARVAKELVSDAHLREDLVQDTLCAALQSPPRAPSTGVLRAWLGRVLRQRVSRGLADLRVELDAESTEAGGPGDWRATCIALMQPPRRWRLPFGLDPRLALIGGAAAIVPAAVWGQTRAEPVALEAIAGAAPAPEPTHRRRTSPPPAPGRDAVQQPLVRQQEQEEATDPAATPLPEAIDAYLEPLVDSGLFSGTVLVARGGELLHEGAYGLAHIDQRRANDIDTGFKLMSVTKALTALAVMRLHEEMGGNLLDRPVVDLLSPWPEGWNDVTVRHLLQHTSGIPNFEVRLGAAARETGKLGAALWPRALEKIQARSLLTQPGDHFAYSNANYVLLATILDANVQVGFQGYLKQSILDPAGMGRTTHDDGSPAKGLALGYFRGRSGEPDPSEQDMSAILGAGDLISTVRDLYALDRALAGGDLLKSASFEAMAVPGPGRGSYGLGWQLDSIAGQACVYHTGGSNGYVANFMRFPAADACIVVLSNFAFAPSGRIGNDLAALLFEDEVTIPQVSPASTLERCSGLYAAPEHPGSPVLVERSGATLMWFPVMADSHRVGGSLLMPLGGGRFAVPHSTQVLEFQLDADSEDPSPVALTRGGGMEAAMTRLPDPAEAWRGVEGSYEVTPPMGSAVSLERDDSGTLHLCVKDGWPLSTELIPLTGDLGLARVYAGGGSTFQLVRDAAGEVAGFRWRDLSNVEYAGKKTR